MPSGWANKFLKALSRVSITAPSYRGTDGEGLKAEPYADPGTKRDFKRHLPAPSFFMPGGEHVTS